MPYLTPTDLRLISTMPVAEFDALVTRAPGFVEAQIEIASSEIDSRLRKRYAVPFTSSVPTIVKRWLEAIITPELYLKRGMDPQNTQLERHFAAAERAREQMKEAADSETGLYDLPLLNTADPSAVSKGGPYGYAEASPYDWIDAQSEAIRGR